LRRARSRASALRQAHRSPNNAEGSVACQERARPHIADGTLVMGTMSYYAPHVVTYPGVTGRVIIGNFASIAADADFHLGGLRRTERVSQHPLRAELALPGAAADGLTYGHGDIVVGSDTWVTTGCAVMSGVTIGDGAVVGTKAVVTQDVRPYAIVVGNPAREVGRRFGDEQIDALLRIRWWDWPVDDVKRHVALLCGPDVDAFIERFDPAR
jgi:acetyltransferase-like isoleucine patch superfamily enzyme